MHRATSYPPTKFSYQEQPANVDPLTTATRGPRGERLELAEVGMILVSLGLLLLTCVETSPIRELAVIGWLVSLGLVGLRNTGAALGIYIAAVSLYSSQYFRGHFSVFERPDHPALLVLLVEVGILRMKNARWSSLDWVTLALVSFLAYTVVNGFLTSTFSTGSMGMLARNFGVPLVLAILVIRARPRIKDVWSFFLVLLIVAAYDVVVSLLWAMDLGYLIFPTWITDPTRYDPESRAGGILGSYGANAKFLSLIFCLVCLTYRTWIKRHGRVLLIIVGAGILMGIFVTYSRAAYLGTIPALAVLFWRKASDGKRTTLKRLFVGSFAAIAILTTVLAPPAKLESRVTKASTVEWRFEIWKIGFRMIPERPLFGYGLRGYSVNAPSFFEESDILTQQGLEASEPAVHNTALNMLIEFGLVGFVLYCAVLYLLFRQAVQCGRLLWGREGVIWIFVFLSVYIIQGQFSVIQDPAVNLIFYGTPALLAGLTWRLESSMERSRRPRGPSALLSEPH